MRACNQWGGSLLYVVWYNCSVWGSDGKSHGFYNKLRTYIIGWPHETKENTVERGIKTLDEVEKLAEYRKIWWTTMGAL